MPRKRRFARSPVPQAAGRKALQLCRQVQEALHWVLGADRNEVLQALQVVSVEPAPSAARLLVTVRAEGADVATALEPLERATGRLRCEIAASIHRRRTPELTFRVM
jgi:ribosome-binding factor A